MRLTMKLKIKDKEDARALAMRGKIIRVPDR